MGRVSGPKGGSGRGLHGRHTLQTRAGSLGRWLQTPRRGAVSWHPAAPLGAVHDIPVPPPTLPSCLLASW